MMCQVTWEQRKSEPEEDHGELILKVHLINQIEVCQAKQDLINVKAQWYEGHGIVGNRRR